MDLTQFRATVAQGAPPEGISFALQTLWWDAKGDWDRAHQLRAAGRRQDRLGRARLSAPQGRRHAQRRRLVQPRRPRTATVSLDEEWQSLTEEMLALDAARRAGGHGRLHGGVQCQGRRCDPLALVPLSACPLP